ncbi:MAG: tryptophan-rich sensory protein [Candidatus Aenigmarchaeota archaeon]|nr:tryptophan-rich sensory protein [Candidatus Aenigmarchaeota archaeon]
MVAEKVDWPKLLGSILACQAAGFIGSFATTPAIPTWYAGLSKPWFSPPNWVFAPVWLLLYTLMGLALYLIIKDGLKTLDAQRGFYAFGAQLGLNILWSILFFGLKSPPAAFICIMLLVVAIIVTTWEFWIIDRRAAYLMMPYLVWVLFATVLNFYIWQLN